MYIHVHVNTEQACRVAESTADTQQKEGEEQDQSGGDGKPSEGTKSKEITESNALVCVYCSDPYTLTSLGDSDGATVTGHETDTKHKEKKLVWSRISSTPTLSLSSLPPSLKTEEVSVLEALAASGLRSIRYALEVPAVTRVVANDYSSEAYKNMCRNIGHNSVEGRVVPSCQEARYVAAASCIFVSLSLAPYCVTLCT